MRKLLFYFGFIAVLLLAAILAALWWRPGWGDRFRQYVAGRPARSAPAEKEVPALPDIALQIHQVHEGVVFQGTPLILSVRLANPRAVNAAAENQARQNYAAELEAAAARGELRGEEVKDKLAGLRRPAPVRAVQLGDETTRWDRFLRFVRLRPGGQQEPLSWTLKLLAPPAAGALTLDAAATAQLDYALEPQAAAGLAPGEYQLLAVLEVPPQAQLRADRWRGRVESGPAKLSIQEKPSLLAPADQEKLELPLAHYYSATGEPARSLEHAQKALSVNPRSIPAHILVGEAKEAQADLQGALAAYQAATQEFYQQYPDSYEAPLYLLYKSNELMQKLNPARESGSFVPRVRDDGRPFRAVTSRTQEQP